MSKRKASVSTDAVALDGARDFGNSAVADTAVQKAVAEVRRSEWLIENADAFARQAEGHERSDHPLAAILVFPGKGSGSA